MNISLEDLRLLLGRSFDEGWNGHFELKQECIEQILENYLVERDEDILVPVIPHGSQNKEDSNISNLGITVTTSSPNLDSNYYYYCTHGNSTLNTNDDSII